MQILMKNKIIPLFVLTIIAGAFLFAGPMSGYAEAEAAVNTSPLPESELLTIDKVWLSGDALFITVTDKNGEGQTLNLKLSDYVTPGDKYITIQATDSKGQTSNSIQFQNPYYAERVSGKSGENDEKKDRISGVLGRNDSAQDGVGDASSGNGNASSGSGNASGGNSNASGDDEALRFDGGASKVSVSGEGESTMAGAKQTANNKLPFAPDVGRSESAESGEEMPIEGGRQSPPGKIESESAIPDGERPAEGSHPFTPDGTGSVIDNAADADGKEFFTVETPDGNTFYLIVDRERNRDNVYLLNAVTEDDLVSLAKPGDGKRESAVTAPGPPIASPPSVTATELPQTQTPKKSGGAGGILFVVIAIIAVGGAGYYFKILRPKLKGANSESDDYDEPDDDCEFAHDEEIDDIGYETEDDITGYEREDNIK